jgi:leucyl aminopeptidase
MDISFSTLALPRTGALALFASEDGGLLPHAERLDRRLKGAIARALKATRFKAKHGQIVEILVPAGLANDRLLVAGAGRAEKLDAVQARLLGAALVSRLLASGEKALAVLAEPVPGAKVAPEAVPAEIALGAALRSYRFDRYRTKLKPEERPSLGKLTLLTPKLSEARRHWRALKCVADGVFFTRDLVTEPANVLYPAEFAHRCKTLEKLGVRVEVLGAKEMRKLGMGAFLGVAQGSKHEPQLVVLQWQGAEPQKKPIAFVGKGVTFDTGGISLKPPAGMHEMKWDMAGAATVAGLFHTLAARKAEANAVGVLGLVENMPSGEAQRPGDVVTSMSGQTIEVLNTDAEGRLVLADCVWYAQSRFKPEALVDLATLTGAMIVTLGHEMAGLFSDDDKLADALLAAGRAEGELLWRLPLSEAYDRKINSMVADVANIGPAGQAGSIMGAQFIKRFTNNVPWAHLDIAGVVWSNEAKPLSEKGATGFGVALLDRFVADRYER